MTELEKRLSARVDELTEKIRQLTEQNQYLIKKLFGSSSEKSKGFEGQMSLFDSNDFLKRKRQLKTKPSKR